ncbi:MAG TPA: S8 family serine peptidase [Planctomycetota bacterium]|nr:S8 family serine peptidase [Planctomycetota bacterium]
MAAFAAAPAVGHPAQSQPTRIELAGGALVHETSNQVGDLRTLAVPGSALEVLVWSETDAHGVVAPWYAISLDGRNVATARATSYGIALERATFDPLAQMPDFSRSPVVWDGEVYLVQFHTQVLAEYRAALEALGATVHDHLVQHTLLARMTPEVRARVQALDVVRWVGPFHPELRLEPGLSEGLLEGSLPTLQDYNVAVFERGLDAKQVVQAAIEAMGGSTHGLSEHGFRFVATLTPAMVASVIALPETASLDVWSTVEPDMDIVRNFGGANYVEGLTGWSGEGVRGEIFDTGIQADHPDFQHDGGVLMHGPSSFDYHGTCCTGIVFGDGTGSASARGLMPNGKIVFGYSIPFLNNGPSNRYVHTAETIDPNLPYQCVFMTSSTGSSLSTSYTSISAEMDDVMFQNDLVYTQSQSNWGSTLSRPEAWAKNIVAVGGIRHLNTLSKNDDFWGSGGSTGPASDGRIKPDLANFYDSVWTTTWGSSYTNFSGTSAATPIVAGHFGLFFQMWHEGAFGNNPTGDTVFESRPSARLARAAVIATANQWTFSGTGHDLTRTHQGWGAPDVKKLFDQSGSTFFVDETHVLDNLETAVFQLQVLPGTDEFKATLVYRDPKAVNFSGVHRINDLSLRVTSPGGTQYWGNNGLAAGNWSTAGGAENQLDVVENVFVALPQSGTWTVEVLGSDINTDVVPAVPGNNADFALWVTGVDVGGCAAPSTYCTAKTTSLGAVPSISWTGGGSAAANNLVLTLADAIPGQNAIPIWGAQQGAIPFQGGTLCIGGTVTRGPLSIMGLFGETSFTETITGAMIGTTRDYQWWFRDPAASFGSGLSNALEITFCP